MHTYPITEWTCLFACPVYFLDEKIEVSASFFANFDARWSSDTLSMPHKQLNIIAYNCSPQIANSLSLIGYAIIETNEQKFD